MITQKIKLNLIPGGILPRIKASQYDTGARTLVFKLFNGSKEFEIPTGSAVSIRGTKSDHTGFQYECEYSGSEVIAKITDQMTVSPGEVLSEIVITKDENRIATENFIFENEEAALKEDVPISHTDIPWIERIDDIVELVEEDAQRAETAADRAETALGQIGDSVEQAAASAASAATSASQASVSASSAATSEQNASTSAASALASQQAAKTSEDNAKESETAASGSASSAALSATNASSSEANAAASELAAAGSASAASESASNASESASLAAASETNAGTAASQAQSSASAASASQTAAETAETNAAASAAAAETSATNAETSETNASASASLASTSATNAANSEALSRKWAVGDSGSGSNVPSDTNNAYYWAQVAASAASGGLKIEIVDTLPTTNIKTDTIYLVPSASPEEKNAKDEYLNTNGTTTGWELIGSTAIDLSGYYTKTQIDALLQAVKDYADAKIAESKLTVDGETILKDANNKISVNMVFFDTLAEAQAAVQAGEVPDNALIYIPGENGGSSDSYTKAQIDAMLDEKADGLNYNSESGRLSLLRGNQELGYATIKSGWKMPSAYAFNQRVDRNWDGLSVLAANATDVTADFDSGALSTKIAAGNFDDYDLGMQIIKTINIDGTNYTAHIIFAHANAFYGGYNSYAVVNTPNIGCVVYVEGYTSKWNVTNTDGGYTSSVLRTSIQKVANAVKAVLGDSHMISHQVLLSSAVSGGKSSSWAWANGSYGEAMSAAQMCGTEISGSYFDTGEAYEQLALFSHVRPNLVYGKVNVWLRDVLTASRAALLGDVGFLDGAGVANTLYVSSLILLK